MSAIFNIFDKLLNIKTNFLSLWSGVALSGPLQIQLLCQHLMVLPPLMLANNIRLRVLGKWWARVTELLPIMEILPKTSGELRKKTLLKKPGANLPLVMVYPMTMKPGPISQQ